MARTQKDSTSSRAGLSPKPKGLVMWVKDLGTSRPNKNGVMQYGPKGIRCPLGLGLDLRATLAALGVGIHRRWSTTPL
ncbi:hypothetical protein DVH24_017538 [Malus domestica]|uniref:Uncharacterized protein n=1 Tax=Malus domestica TaxID=3750 RepID=A0A498K844_MALDO|nr:hypothetical protein DVH24_004099 [Malus domestica]RXI09607.1 hypothetical protein DVH24_013222 [Malus domestica]RXI09689.1 hypothetical protein DVH24_017538 [Malus domestica]